MLSGRPACSNKTILLSITRVVSSTVDCKRPTTFSLRSVVTPMAGAGACVLQPYSQTDKGIASRTRRNHRDRARLSRVTAPLSCADPDCLAASLSHWLRSSEALPPGATSTSRRRWLIPEPDPSLQLTPFIDFRLHANSCGTTRSRRRHGYPSAKPGTMLTTSDFSTTMMR